MIYLALAFDFGTGLLTTKKAEELLTGSAPGSFLIRVSEKIKGYVLSFLSAEGCKHFLIDASGDSYSFLGVDQLQHSTLADLVDYHKVGLSSCLLICMSFLKHSGMRNVPAIGFDAKER